MTPTTPPPTYADPIGPDELIEEARTFAEPEPRPPIRSSHGPGVFHGIDALWVWFGDSPGETRQQPLMAVMDVPDVGLALRPLMAVTGDAAERLRDTAVEAARRLEVRATLAEFRCVGVTALDIRAFPAAGGEQ